jgi:PTS system glucose-specific IIA component
VAAIAATGRNPIVPVIILEKSAENIALADAVGTGAQPAAGDELLTVSL